MSAVERAPDLKRVTGLLNTLEATVGSFWAMDPEHRDRQGYGDAMVRARAALLAEFESLTSSLRAVDAKVVEWRERAQRAEAELLKASDDPGPEWIPCPPDCLCDPHDANEDDIPCCCCGARAGESCKHGRRASLPSSTRPNGSNEGGAP